MATVTRLLACLRRDGMIPSAAVISVMTTSNTAEYYFENPLSSTFFGLVIGGIGGGLIESIAPLQTRPFISGGILLASGLNVIGRTMGWIQPPNPQSPSITITTSLIKE